VGSEARKSEVVYMSYRIFKVIHGDDSASYEVEESFGGEGNEQWRLDNICLSEREARDYIAGIDAIKVSRRIKSREILKP